MRLASVADADVRYSPRNFTTCSRALRIARSRAIASDGAGGEIPQKFAPSGLGGRLSHQPHDPSSAAAPAWMLAAVVRNAKYMSLKVFTFFHPTPSLYESSPVTPFATFDASRS